MEDLKVDPIYKKGFEHGYWLSHGKDAKTPDFNSGAAAYHGYFLGMKAGRDQAAREHIRSRMADLKAKAANSKDKDKGMERD